MKRNYLLALASLFAAFSLSLTSCDKKAQIEPLVTGGTTTGDENKIDDNKGKDDDNKGKDDDNKGKDDENQETKKSLASKIAGTYEGSFKLQVASLPAKEEKMTYILKENGEDVVTLEIGTFIAGMGGEPGKGLKITSLKITQEGDTFKLVSKQEEGTFEIGGAKKKFKIKGEGTVVGNKLMLKASYKPGRAPFNFKLVMEGEKK